MKRMFLAAASIAALTTTACTTAGGGPYGQPGYGQQRNNTAIGAGAGAVLGGAAGAIFAGEGDDLEGAAIGAGIGALAGAAVGNYMDRQQRQLNQELAGTGVEVDRRGDNLVLNMPGDITFGFDSANIQPQFNPVLNDIAGTLQEFESTTVNVVGHADSVGSDQYNQQLSERRARAVADALVSRGVIPQRIYVAGRGEAEPIASNETEEGRARNRRVEIVLQPITQS